MWSRFLKCKELPRLKLQVNGSGSKFLRNFCGAKRSCAPYNEQSEWLNNTLPQNAQVVICGAGAVGNSVAYYLSKNGWTDIVVLEQSKIGSGESWRSCGIVGHFHSTSAGIISKNSSELYKELQDQGQDVGFKSSGCVNVARTRERMTELRRIAAEARIQGLDCEILSPKDIEMKHPLVRTDGLEGGIWVPSDGTVDPLAVCRALAKLAQDAGVRYFQGCQVHKVLTDGVKVVSVDTDFGNISCEYFVLCGGMWSKHLGQVSYPQFKIPIHAAENSYVITRPAPGVTPNTPTLRDYDGGIYCREYDSGFLVGGFPCDGRPLFTDGIPPKFEFQELTTEWSHFQPLYDEARLRIPVLNQVDIQRFVSGPDTFTPDGQWIVGQTAEIDNLYVAVGMNGNSVQGAGGLGKELANWITRGEPESYVLPFDIRRFIALHSNQKFLNERIKEAVGRRYAIQHPLLSEFSTARKTRCSPLYTVQDAAGAVFGERMGFERALYFDTTKTKEERLHPPKQTFGKPEWFDAVKEEYLACRERVGIIDMSSFTKFHLKSGSTEVVDLLQLLCSNDVDVPVGNIISSGMQNEQGCYENDCLLLRRAHNCYFMMSPTAQQTRITEWMRKHLPSDGSVSVRDVTSMYTVLNVVGPKSKELMMELTKTDMDLPGFTCKKMNVGYAGEVLVMGFNNTGEPGYSLYIPSEYALHVYHNLLGVGQDYGVKNVGYYALRFLRIEKFVPFWAEEIDSHTTPFEVGRGFKVKMQKEYFLGKFALQHQLEKGLHRRLVHIQLDGHNAETDVWPWGREPIYRNGQYVGMTTSSGYGFTLGRVVCLGFVCNYNSSGEPEVVTSDFVTKNDKFEVEIASKRYPARVSLHPPKIPVVSMSGANTKYMPKARTKEAHQ